eukprot:CAMPEP_0119303996 /NCGR_PEP_ID=MMETSP1333-20130426/5325_1 /TAXON_ID=418940 /ORGANISM="Scyphosphaera apsteinii, Strain RCC1455" /LENGTH=172 /DNA_ID=CAMNT_0007306793 /DNA_START=548 /DNA_END=1066 /DNA_ORIENTATION=+
MFKVELPIGNIQRGHWNKEQSLECVAASDVLSTLGFDNGTRIDLLSIDIEGNEAEVLRCFPFARFGVYAVLIESDKVVDVRQLDRFFHRHGYANVETFVAEISAKRKVLPSQSAAWLDSLYVFQKPPIYPPVLYPEALRCSSAARFHTMAGRYCKPFHMWEPVASPWGECAS